MLIGVISIPLFFKTKLFIFNNGRHRTLGKEL